MHWVVKLIIAWRLAPFLPAAVEKMGSCVSALVDNDGLRNRVQQLEQQLAATGGGGGAAAAAGGGAGPASMEVLFFPDPAM